MTHKEFRKYNELIPVNSSIDGNTHLRNKESIFIDFSNMSWEAVGKADWDKVLEIHEKRFRNLKAN